MDKKLILAKAPLRISAFGGSSDIPAHYLQWGGATISLAIDKFVYVAVGKTPQNHIKLNYSKQECVTNVDDIQHDIVRNTLKFFNISSNIEITTFADIPTIGTGLGGSSAFTSALISALVQYLGLKPYNEYELAETACHTEINLCGFKIGKQDAYASAFGGMNYIKYLQSDRVIVSKMDPNGIDSCMVLIPTNIQRHSSDILEKIDFDKKSHIIRELSNMADQQSQYLPSFDNYGFLLNKAWELKKQTENSISNPEIDLLYDRCISAGASGAKLLGSGGGGYMLAMTGNKSKIKNEFSDRVCLDVQICNQGAGVVYAD